MSLAIILARSLFRVNASDDTRVELRTLSYAAFLQLIYGELLVPVSERRLYRYQGMSAHTPCHTMVVSCQGLD
jgi:hypothetical protein